jgi:tripartite-type tricarboxylate transporter receptor subunit TctC
MTGMIRAFLATLLAAASLVAHAQAWPAKQVRFVVPFAPGGTTDILARLLGQHLSESLGQPFVIDNRSGAGGNIGAAEVAKAPPDGYTIMMGTPGTQAINQFIYTKMPYDTQKDFAPVSFVARVPNVLVVHPGVGVKSLQDLISYARANPNKLNSASPGAGTTGHLSLELFKKLAGVQIQHVPYKGSGPALNDLIGGQVQMTIDNLPSAMPHIQSGKLLALGVTTEQKVDVLPHVPTVASVVRGYEASSWFVVVAPAGTPEPVINRLSAEIDKTLKKPVVLERMKTLGAEPVGGTPQALARHIATETEKWRDVARLSGAKLD